MVDRTSQTYAPRKLSPSPGGSSSTSSQTSLAPIHPEEDTPTTERRAFPRIAVDCPATVTPLSGAGNIPARLTDLSRGGCRLVTNERVSIPILTRVEVSFMLRGYSFRLVGVSAGSRKGQSFAVRFLEMPHRRAEELAEVIEEIAALPPAPATSPAPSSESPRPMPDSAQHQPGTDRPLIAKTSPEETPVRPNISNNRRAHQRHQVDTRVNLTLVRGAITMPGRILNLSQGGCRLRTDEHFKVGIYTRVEAEFYLHGLPFRLAGVSQAIMDRNTIGVRFLDMSDRKREHLTELIAEIEAAEMDLDHPTNPSQHSALSSEQP